jgi:hypothetical protein
LATSGRIVATRWSARSARALRVSGVSGGLGAAGVFHGSALPDPDAALAEPAALPADPAAPRCAGASEELRHATSTTARAKSERIPQL